MDLETIKLKIRKNKDIIYVNGYGVLVFMLWSLIKIILYLVDIAPEISPGVQNELDIIYSSLIATTSVVEDALTIITGIVAIQVGKKNKPRYVTLVVLSAITCLLSLQFVVGDIFLCTAIINSDALNTVIIGVLTDTFFLTITLFLTIAAFKLNKLRKLEKEATNER